MAAETKNSTRKVLPQDFYLESVMFWKINIKHQILNTNIMDNGGPIIHQKNNIEIISNMKIVLLFYIGRNFFIQ